VGVESEPTIFEKILTRLLEAELMLWFKTRIYGFPKAIAVTASLSWCDQTQLYLPTTSGKTDSFKTYGGGGQGQAALVVR
jgi:hypothetical protein